MLKYETSDAWWYESGEVRFHADQDGKGILCRVTFEFLTDRLGSDPSASACLDKATAIYDGITALVGDKIQRGLFAPDGSVIVTNDDRLSTG